MSNMVLGAWAGGGDVKLDLARLLLTRMLIQANSGNGKSWALRRLFERAAGLVQQIIVDPEGEFASLREKHDFVIVAANGGDAAAHPRTAALLALRLLETEASAVLDISELKAADRHTFVRLLFESLIDAPKNLRHPVLVALDEAQMFAPEKGQGESEATDSVIDMATRGRKRGLCLIAATQRISMFHKGVAAELKNRMIGGTSLDVDVKRAAFDLGMPPKDALVVLRALEPGHFFAFGPALNQLEPREFVTGDVETSHPKVGHRQAAPPKPTAAIVALLPKLADLAQEAEERARSMDDLKRELVQARRELSIAKKQQPIAAPAQIVKGDPAAEKRYAAQISKLTELVEELMKFIVTINAKDFTAKAGESVDGEALQKAIEAAVSQSRKLIEQSMDARNRELQTLQREGGRIVARVQKLLESQDVRIAVEVKHNEPFTVAQVAKSARPIAAAPVDGSSVTGMQRKILTALAWLEDKGIDKPSRPMLGAVAGVKSTGGYFGNTLSALKTAGLVDYPGDGCVTATDEGRAQVGSVTSDGEVYEQWLSILSGLERQIIAKLVEEHPRVWTREELGNALGKESGGGYFGNTISYLKTLGAIDYPQKGSVQLSRYVMP